MHELGIVVHISKTLEELAQENNITDIRRVTLQIGKVSGIIPEYLVDCWKYYKKKVPLIENSTLEYEWIEAITICNECEKTYDTIQYGRECPFCKSEHTVLLQGNECLIKEIEGRISVERRFFLLFLEKFLFFYVYEYVGNAY